MAAEPVPVPDEPEKAAEGDTEAPEGETPADDEPETSTLKALAEKLGVEPSDLYKVKIGLSDGEQMTLGQMKDKVQSLTDLDGEKQQLTQQKIDFENLMLRERNEVSAILEKVAHAVTPEMVEQTRVERDQHIAQERTKLLEAVPDWQDAEKYQADREAIVELAKEYSVTEAEVAQTNDHRLVKMMRDFVELKKLVGSANAEAKKLRSAPKGAKPGKPVKATSSLDTLIKQAKATNRMDEKIPAMNAILGVN